MKHKHHIIPKHIGGTDDPSNIIELTVEEHAEAHRVLWEKYNRDQDWLAWKGLSKQIGKEEIIKKYCSIASKKYWDNISDEDYQQRKNNAFGGNNFSREYLKRRNAILCSKFAEIYTPDGKMITISNIRKFCTDNNINYGNMKSVLRGERKSCGGFGGKYVII